MSAKKRVFVAGASGFAGRNLVEHLVASSRYEVFACTDGEGDLRDHAAAVRLVGAFAPDAVVNCAAMVTTRKTGYDQNPADVLGTNLAIFFNLLRARPAGAQLIHLGSGAEYDRRAYRPAMTEEYFNASVPADAYGFSKYVASMYAALDPGVTILRIFGLYGKYEDYTYKFVSNAVVKALLGLPITVNQNCVFDFLPVGDLCRAVEAVIERGAPRRHYNIVPPQRCDLLSLARAVSAAAPAPVEIRVLNPGLGAEYSGSNARFLEDFPGFAFTPHAEAIAALFAYYRENLDRLDTAAVREDPYLKNCRTAKR